MQLSSGKPQYQSTRRDVVGGPHESPIAEVFNGYGLIDYGVPMANSFHTYLAKDKCITCHMYPNPASGQPGHNKVGDHTFSMSYMDGTNKVENLAACTQCHAETMTSFDYVPSGNWGDIDGNGVISGVQTEVQGLLNELRDLMIATGMSVDDTTKAGTILTNGLSANVAIKDAQLKASWNWLMIHRDASLGVHNTQYTIRALQTTYTDLSTNWTGNATNTFKNAFPAAYLR
jgi:hypothetical protein